MSTQVVNPQPASLAEKVQWCLDLVGAPVKQGRIDQNGVIAGQQKVIRQNNTNDRLKTLDTFKQQAFTVGAADQMDLKALKSGKHFDRVVKVLRMAETNRSPKVLNMLEAVAQDYLDHAERDLSDKEKAHPTTAHKKDVCLKAIRSARLWAMTGERDALGPPPWSGDKEARANALDAKLAFEENARGTARPKNPDPGSGASGSWRVEGKSAGDKDLFIFKPSDAENHLGLGWVEGGGAAREALAKRLNDSILAQTGLDLGVCPTTVCKIANDKLPQIVVDEFGQAERHPTQQGEFLQTIDRSKSSQRVGSMQEILGGAKGLATAFHDDPTLQASVPQSEVEKIAVLDFITMNLDRHGENVMMQRDPQTNAVKLLPIDHGNALPSPDALRGHRGRINSWVILTMPQSKQPISQTMRDQLDLLDEDLLIEQMRQARKTIAKQDPSMGSAISDDDLKLSLISIKVLKRAAKQGFTIAEIADIYRHELVDLQNVADDDLDVALQAAGVAARQREADRAALAKFPDAETRLKALGWADGGFTAWTMDLDDRPGLFLKALRGNIVHPAKAAQRQDLINKLGGINAVSQEILDLPVQEAIFQLSRQWKTQSEAQAKQKLGNLGFAFFDQLKPKDRSGVIKQALEYVDNGGEAALRLAGVDPTNMDPLAKTQAYMQHKLQRLGGDNPQIPQAIKNICGGEFENWNAVSFVERLTILENWAEFNRLGGVKEFLRLGADANPEIGLENKLEEFHRLIALEAGQGQLDQIDDSDSHERELMDLFNQVADQLNRLPVGPFYTQHKLDYQAAEGLSGNGQLDEAQVALHTAIKRGAEEFRRIRGGG